MTRKQKLEARLSSYWKLELGNVLIVPGIILFFAFTSEYTIGPLTYFSFIPVMLLLIIGGIYWRAKLLALQGDKAALTAALKLVHVCQLPSLILTIIATALSLASWFMPPLSASLGDKLTASGMSLLAILEYMNYYHRQLQHFDHAEDFQRLKSGKGFRRAQMAVDLSRWRKGRRRAG